MKRKGTIQYAGRRGEKKRHQTTHRMKKKKRAPSNTPDEERRENAPNKTKDEERNGINNTPDEVERAPSNTPDRDARGEHVTSLSIFSSACSATSEINFNKNTCEQNSCLKRNVSLYGQDWTLQKKAPNKTPDEEKSKGTKQYAE